MPQYSKSVDWNKYVLSESFDRDCDTQSRHNPSSSRAPYDNSKPWSGGKVNDDSSLTSITSDHTVSESEAFLYYYGVRGDGKPGPKLVYRTSKDVFTPPVGPFPEPRTMQLLTVHEHDKLSQGDLWVVIRQKTVELLDRSNIMHTSVDLVRFRWGEHADGRSQTSTSITIWVGVVPDSTSGQAAFEAAQDILKLLHEHDIYDIEVAFRESVALPLSGPALYAPVDQLHPLKEVIDRVTTSLYLPIAGLNTPNMQGSLGFYFKIGEDLYGVTSRHVLFPDAESNVLYRYNAAAPKRMVVLMGNPAFDSLRADVQLNISTLNHAVPILQRQLSASLLKAQSGDEKALEDRDTHQRTLDKTEATITELKNFFAVLMQDWSDLSNRVIGHVVWSPPITGMNPPHGYTRDVCVIKLDNAKFIQNFKGNVIDLGTEIEPPNFMVLLYPRYDAPSEFEYPAEDRLYRLRIILPAAQIRVPNSLDFNGDRTRFVIKRGLGSLTTVGRLNGFESHRRQYGLSGAFDSVEAAVYAYNSKSGPFSRGGDSGAAVVGANNDLVAQITGGSGVNSSDITYGTPIEWLWNSVIKMEFPDAVLFFDPNK